MSHRLSQTVTIVSTVPENTFTNTKCLFVERAGSKQNQCVYPQINLSEQRTQTMILHLPRVVKKQQKHC